MYRSRRPRISVIIVPVATLGDLGFTLLTVHPPTLATIAFSSLCNERLDAWHQSNKSNYHNAHDPYDRAHLIYIEIVLDTTLDFVDMDTLDIERLVEYRLYFFNIEIMIAAMHIHRKTVVLWPRVDAKVRLC
jgi:hypothetical protein